MSENNLGDPAMINKLNDLTYKMTQGIRLMGKYGRELAKTERDYKVELAKEVVRLREDGVPVTLIQLRVHGTGEVSNLRFKRDLAQALYDTSKENINVLKLQIRLLESQIDREWNS